MADQTILTLPPGAAKGKKTQDILDQITSEADKTSYAVPNRPAAVLRRDTGVGMVIPNQGKYLVPASGPADSADKSKALRGSRGF